MKTKLIILLLFVNISFAQKFNFNCIDIDPTFQPYYDAFMEDAARYGHDFSGEAGRIVFTDQLASNVNGGSIGSCFDGFNIIINRGSWDYQIQQLLDFGYPTLARLWPKRLIYHELGHALLERGHVCNVSGEYSGWAVIHDDIMRSGSSCDVSGLDHVGFDTEGEPILGRIIDSDANFNVGVERLFMNIDQRQLRYWNCSYTGKGPAIITCE